MMLVLETTPYSPSPLGPSKHHVCGGLLNLLCQVGYQGMLGGHRWIYWNWPAVFSTGHYAIQGTLTHSAALEEQLGSGEGNPHCKEPWQEQQCCVCTVLAVHVQIVGRWA